MLADLPRHGRRHRQLEIDRAGLDPVIVSFNDVDPDLIAPWRRTRSVRRHRSPARIVLPDGTLVASWPQ